MSLEFEEEKFYRNHSARSEQTGWVTRLFIKFGLAKDSGSSIVPMIVVAVICFALAIFFFSI